jgi:AraC-like DNA-binding protein
METNFAYNLKLEEYAKLCHRSLSKFKRDFFNHYNTTPGKWLLERRVSHATQLLLNGNQNITHVAFESGFEDVSHFSRVFKKKHGLSPRNYLKSVST